MRRPPARLLMENVAGFVGSGSHAALRGALAAGGYEVQKFVVSPHQLGVPYSRPRYFALAVRRPLRFPRAYDCSEGPVEHPPALHTDDEGADGTAIGSDAATIGSGERCSCGSFAGRPWRSSDAARSSSEHEQTAWREPSWPGVYDAGPYPHPGAPFPCRPLAAFLESPAPRPETLARLGHDTQRLYPATPDGDCQAAVPSAAVSTSACAEGEGAPGVEDGTAIGPGDDPWVSHAVPASTLARYWRVLDVVTPACTYSTCFTKHYGSNVRGAGSLLASQDFADRFCARDARGRLHFAAPPPLPQSHDRARGSAAEAGNDPGDRLPVVMRRRRAHSRGGCGASSDGEAGRGLPIGQMDGTGTAPALEAGAPAACVCSGPPDKAPPGRPEAGQSPESSQLSTSAELHRRTEAQVRDAALEESVVEASSSMEAAVLGLLFFTPAEVAALHGMPGPATWARRAERAGVPRRQQYALLGNGLSVHAAEHLLRYLLAARPR